MGDTRQGCYIQWTSDGATKPTVLLFDVTTSEGHHLTSNVTDHPVEKGADIADHVRKELDQVTIEVFVSNAPLGDKYTPSQDDASENPSTPLDIPTFKAPFSPTPGGVTNLIGDGIGAIKSLLTGGKDPVQADVISFSGETNYVAQTLITLREIQKNNQLVTVVTPSADYHSMALEVSDLQRSPEDGTSGRFMLHFKEVRIVESRLVNAPKPIEPRGQKEVPKAVQGPKQDDPKTSVLKQGFDAGKKLLGG